MLNNGVYVEVVVAYFGIASWSGYVEWLTKTKTNPLSVRSVRSCNNNPLIDKKIYSLLECAAMNSNGVSKWLKTVGNLFPRPTNPVYLTCKQGQKQKEIYPLRMGRGITGTRDGQNVFILSLTQLNSNFSSLSALWLNEAYVLPIGPCSCIITLPTPEPTN